MFITGRCKAISLRQNYGRSQTNMMVTAVLDIGAAKWLKTVFKVWRVAGYREEVLDNQLTVRQMSHSFWRHSQKHKSVLFININTLNWLSSEEKTTLATWPLGLGYLHWFLP